MYDNPRGAQPPPAPAANAHGCVILMFRFIFKMNKIKNKKL